MILAWASMEKPHPDLLAAYDPSIFLARIICDVATGCGFIARGLAANVTAYRIEDAEQMDSLFLDPADGITEGAAFGSKRGHVVAIVDDSREKNSFIMVDVGIPTFSVHLNFEIEPVAAVLPLSFINGEAAVAVSDDDRAAVVRYAATPTSRGFADSPDWSTPPGSGREKLRRSARNEWAAFLPTDLRKRFQMFDFDDRRA